MTRSIPTMIVLSFLVGALLMMIPLPYGINWFHPQWILLILLFWTVRAPEYCGVGVAWCVGLWIDCLTGAPLGQHALVYAFLIYLILKLQTPFFSLPYWQQMGVVLFFSSVDLLLQKIMLEATGHSITHFSYWLPLLLSTVCWPIVYGFLNRLYPKRVLY